MNELVKRSYDLMAMAYQEGRKIIDSRRYLDLLASELPEAAAVLDVACGSGLPVASYLVERRFAVTGIDISPVQVEWAKRQVPAARFEERDMLSLQAGEFSVQAIVALYSLFHVPREEHAGVLKVFRSFLPVDGALLLTMGASDWEGREEDFYGQPMRWSHFGPEKNRALVEEAGFRVRLDEINDSGGERHQVILASASPPA